MSTLPYLLLKSFTLEKYFFRDYIGFFVICFPPFLYLYKLVKQVYVHNTLTITPPHIQQNKACFVWEVVTFIEGAPSKKHFKTQTHTRKQIKDAVNKI